MPDASLIDSYSDLHNSIDRKRRVAACNSFVRRILQRSRIAAFQSPELSLFRPNFSFDGRAIG